MILEGLLVDIEGELSHFQIEVDKGFDAAYHIIEFDWKDWGNFVEGNARFAEVGLVKGDFDSLVLGKVLDNKPVLLSFHEELKSVGSDQTSTF